MTVQSEIDRIAGAKSDIATAIANKGVAVPSGTKLDGMSALIDSISGGGGGGSSKGGFSVTFPAAGSNYSNRSINDVAYILKADGTVLDITDHTVVAGKTIDGVVLFTAGSKDGPFGIMFNFKGKVTLFVPHSAGFGYPVVETFNDTHIQNEYGIDIFKLQFFIPNSDLTITSISSYNTD